MRQNMQLGHERLLKQASNLHNAHKNETRPKYEYAPFPVVGFSFDQQIRWAVIFLVEIFEFRPVDKTNFVSDVPAVGLCWIEFDAENK